MKVIIVGLGRVGKTLVSELCKEGHDIVALDSDAAILQECVDRLDIQGICGNGCIAENLKEAGIKTCDMLVSVTPHDENNILCCLIARSLGAKHVIARVRDPEYFKQMEFMQKNLGINMLVNPEEAVSHEILHILRFPAAVKISTFSGRKVDIVELKLPDGCPLTGKTLAEFRKDAKYPFLVVAIERDGETRIPDGNEVLKKGDVISICARHSEVRSLFRSLKLINHKVQSVMILGDEREAFYLARELEDSGFFVKIVNKSYESSVELKGGLKKTQVICGDYTNRELLESEGIDGMDAVVCMSSHDENNIVAAIYAKMRGVDKTISVLHSDSYYGLLDSVHLDTTISPYRLAAANIARYLRAINVDEGSQVRAMYKIADESAEALLFRLSNNEDMIGKCLKDLKVRKGILIAAVVRAKVAYIPDGNFILEKDDDIVVIAMNSHIKQLKEIIQP